MGEEVAKYILDPLCRGVTAGDARELSVRSTFAFLHESEANYGSVIKGMLKENRYKTVADFSSNNLVKKAFEEFWRMWTLKSGMAELIDTLACTVEERGVTDLIFNAKCTGLKFNDNKAEVSVENENIKVDHVFAGIPAWELSKLVPAYPVLAENLRNISAVDVGVVHLEYEHDHLGQKGFGFLTPSFEDSKVLGIIFDSCCFPELNGTSKTRVSCMIGGRWFKKLFGDPKNVTDDTLFQTAKEAVRKHLGIADEPVRHKVLVQQQCIPQYVVGHYSKLENFDQEIKKNNLCLSLIGASYKGAGVPDCIYNARLGVENYLKSL